MGDWLDLHAVCVNEWMRRKWLENGLGYTVYIHYTLIQRLRHVFAGSMEGIPAQMENYHRFAPIPSTTIKLVI